MTRIQLLRTGEIVDAVAAYDGNETWWEVGARDFSPHLVRVLGRHEGEYDPNHPGELAPDAWDRESHKIGAGRHLLHTGVE